MAKRLKVSRDRDVALSVVEASRISGEVGLSEHDCNKVATAVSELARNILKYAGTGEIEITKIEREGRAGVEVKARDQGPGIADIQTALQDHFSTSGTLGLGLPGIKRMMDEFEIESESGRGTQVTCRKWKPRASGRVSSRLMQAVSRQARQSTTNPISEKLLKITLDNDLKGLDCAYYVRPCRGEFVSGDAVVLDQRVGLVLLGIIDALGHGSEANKVALRAKSVVRNSWTSDVVATISAVHESLKGTIGAAAGIAVPETETGLMSYAAAGNTVCRIIGSRSSRCLVTPGTLGARIRSPQLCQFRLGDGDLVLLYTDGVTDRFELEDYPQMQVSSASNVAKTIVERFGRRHDDASCVVMRYRR
jgi:anti-sigma regulatory factor (Ser/Thr protein kinase)